MFFVWREKSEVESFGVTAEREFTLPVLAKRRVCSVFGQVLGRMKQVALVRSPKNLPSVCLLIRNRTWTILGLNYVRGYKAAVSCVFPYAVHVLECIWYDR